MTETADVVLDEMHVKHLVDGRGLTLYNMITVTLAGENTDTGYPCP